MERKYTWRFVLMLMLVASALTCLILFLTLGRKLGILDGKYKAMRTFSALLNKIDELYIGEYDESTLITESMYAAVNSLDDNWSYYMTADEYKDYLSATNNVYAGVGIGVELDPDNAGIRVLTVYANSPAERSGIVPGDVVTAIDDMSFEGLVLSEIITLMLRESGQQAKLTVLRTDSSVEDLHVTYEMVFTDPVSYQMLGDNVGHIMIENFDSGAAESFVNACVSLIDDGAESFIFDVRNNGGGRVSELTAMLDYLLPEGEIFVAVNHEGKETVTWSDAECLSLPFAVLVNKYSYSAAEYFAAMLSEYNCAVTVGEQTTGKNRSQVTVELPYGNALHISSGEYLTKDRVSLYDAGGLTPDYVVEISDEEFSQLFYGVLETSDDTQLMKAVEVIG